MPSVGSTPTTSSPALQQQQSLQSSMAPAQHSSNAVHLPPQNSSSISLQQQHAKIQQQHSLPLQLQYQVTTTQPSPAGMFISQTAGIISSTAALGNTASFFNAATSGADLSPTSSTASFSSVDTNQTLLNSIAANQQQQQQQQQQSSQSSGSNQHHHLSSLGQKNSYSSSSGGHGNGSTTSKAIVPSSNRSYRTKYSQFMIITPAVSIDRDFDRTDTLSSNAADNHGFHTADDDPYPHNGNIFRFNNLQASIDSGNSSDSGSFRSNYNPYLHNSRQHLLPKSAPPFYNFSPSSWCNLICAAMRCFGAGGGGGGGAGGSGRNRSGMYSTSFGRPPYQRSRSSGPHTSSKTPHRRLRSYSTSSFTPETAFEHFSAPFKARKTRDEQNNIAYEL